MKDTPQPDFTIDWNETIRPISVAAHDWLRTNGARISRRFLESQMMGAGLCARRIFPNGTFVQSVPMKELLAPQDLLGMKTNGWVN